MEAVSVEVSEGEVDRLLEVEAGDVEPPEEVSFCRNVFLPLSTACVNSCDYCAFYDSAEDAELMTPEKVEETLRRGREAGCTEALFSYGTRPESYPEIGRGLEELGFDDGVDYLYSCCERALDLGLLPHSNPGLLTYEELERLAPVNASMGLMLETTSDVPAHEPWETKQPERRLRHIRDAGELEVPFTTGVLVGLGEGWRDRAESLLAVAEMHERFGHVQEVIVQNVVSNERSSYEQPSHDAMRRCVAMAREALPEEVEVQVPPNLTPGVPELIQAGVGDLGGVSPVTDDYVNPDYPWPEVDRLKETAEAADAELVERLPVYERYVERGWLSDQVAEAICEGDGLKHVLDEDLEPPVSRGTSGGVYDG